MKCKTCGAELPQENMLGAHYFWSDCVAYLKAEITRLQSESRWIPVSERLPEVNDPVLTIYSARDGIGSIQKRCYVGSEMWYDFEDMINISQRNITHWQPLPTPPTEG
jgi:hypothetical protein